MSLSAVLICIISKRKRKRCVSFFLDANFFVFCSCSLSIDKYVRVKHEDLVFAVLADLQTQHLNVEKMEFRVVGFPVEDLHMRSKVSDHTNYEDEIVFTLISSLSLIPPIFYCSPIS